MHWLQHKMASREARDDNVDVDDEDGKDSRCDCSTECLVNWALPLLCIFSFVAIMVAFFWFGPTEILKWMFSYIPEKPTTTDALILIAVISLCVILSIPLWPPLCLVAGVMFGFWYGFVIIFVSLVIGSVASFYLGRTVLKEQIRSWIMDSDWPRVKRFMRMLERPDKSLKFLILFRFIHISLTIRNYVPSIMNVNAWHFFISVVLHSIWAAVVFALVGASLKSVADVFMKGEELTWDHIEWWQWAFFGVAIAAGLLLMWYAIKEYNAECEEEDNAGETQPLTSGSSAA